MTRGTEALLAAVLSTAHLEMLRDESGISDAVIEENVLDVDAYAFFACAECCSHHNLCTCDESEQR